MLSAKGNSRAKIFPPKDLIVSATACEMRTVKDPVSFLCSVAFILFDCPLILALVKTAHYNIT